MLILDPELRMRDILNHIKNSCITDDSIHNVHTPYSLCEDIIFQLSKRIKLDAKNMSILVMFNLEFFITLVDKYNVKPENITFISDSWERNMFAEKIGAEVFDIDDIDDFIKKIKLGEYIMGKKFKVVVGNPPYQKGSLNGKKNTQPIWQYFVEFAFSTSVENGSITLVHPSGWRSVKKTFKKVQKLLTSKQMICLNMNHFKDGQDTFDSAIDFDWYCLENIKDDKFLTRITFQDDVVRDVNIYGLKFIPSKYFDKIMSLVAQEGEEKVKIISDSSYHTQKSCISKEKNDNYVYPCVYTVRTNNEPTFYWSSLNNKGHYEIPKVIWANGASGVFVDRNGKCALTQFAYAIADDVENLDGIKKALESDEFIEDIMGYKHSLGDRYNRKIIETFRKNFWRKFI